MINVTWVSRESLNYTITSKKHNTEPSKDPATANAVKNRQSIIICTIIVFAIKFRWEWDGCL